MDACLGGHGVGGAACCLGEKAGVPTGQQGGQSSLGEQRKQIIEAGHIWWQQGLGQKGFECARTLSMGEQGRFWSRTCGTRELYRDGSVVGAGE